MIARNGQCCHPPSVSVDSLESPISEKKNRQEIQMIAFLVPLRLTSGSGCPERSATDSLKRMAMEGTLVVFATAVLMLLRDRKSVV